MRKRAQGGGEAGKPDGPIDVPPGEIFQVFDDKRLAVERNVPAGGHGWVVLCSVPVGIRAVFG